MVAKIQTNANNLARPRDGRAEPYVWVDKRRVLSVRSSPVSQPSKPIALEELLVILGNETSRFDASPLGQNQAWLFFSRIAKSNELHPLGSSNAASPKRAKHCRRSGGPVPKDKTPFSFAALHLYLSLMAA